MEKNKTSEKFLTAAPKIMDTIIKSINKIKNLELDNDVSEEHKDQIQKTLKKEIEDLKKSFSTTKDDSNFTLK